MILTKLPNTRTGKQYPATGMGVLDWTSYDDAYDAAQMRAYARENAQPIFDALENCRLFASKNRNEPWARTILAFCSTGGSVGSPLRQV